MKLQDYTTEELRAELKRRTDLVKEEKPVLTPGIKDGDILSYQAVRFATEEEKQKLSQAIKDNRYKWDAKTKTLKKLVKPKFDTKTLQPFDRVLVKVGSYWRIEWFSNMYEYRGDIYYACAMSSYKECIPYNDETKHLLGTTDEAPEYYRYWED